ncbi:hypothetical protein [Streptomyces sp. NPDC000851]
MPLSEVGWGMDAAEESQEVVRHRSVLLSEHLLGLPYLAVGLGKLFALSDDQPKPSG